MGTTLTLLRDGLRLSLLQRPRRLPSPTGFEPFFVLMVLAIALHAAAQWSMVEAPRALNPWGLQTEAMGTLLTLMATALICAVAGRRVVFWPAAGWLVAAMLPSSVVAGAAYLAVGEAHLLYFYAWWLAVAWNVLIFVRLALFVCEGRWPRALTAAALATGIVLGPWYWLPQQALWTTQWPDEETDESWEEPGTLADAEAAMYAQPERLQAAVDALAPQRPDRIDLYAVAFGGDASENVFRNEVEYAQHLFETRLDAKGRVLTLLNHPQTAEDHPLATATNLERGLRGVAQHMDVEQDILLLYLTSHGSDDHWLYVNQPPLPLDQIDPPRLRAALDGAGIRWRVLVVSACYSGGWIDALRDARTLVLTAARADRTSFGCGAQSDITWFGDAFLVHALNETTDFIEAFRRASALIAQWEKEDDYTPSQPQLDEGRDIGARLEAWRATLPAVPRVEFTRRRERANPRAP